MLSAHRKGRGDSEGRAWGEKGGRRKVGVQASRLETTEADGRNGAGS